MYDQANAPMPAKAVPDLGLCAQLDQLAAHLAENHNLLDGIVPREAGDIREEAATVRGVVGELQDSAAHLSRRLVVLREALGNKWPL